MRQEMNPALSAALTAALFGAAASGQTATVTLQAPASAVPGETVSVAVVCDFDASGAGDGIFGAAGLFAFGGNVVATGPGTPSNVVVSASLPALRAAGTASGAGITRVGGAVAGLMSSLPPGPVTLLTLDVTIDADAAVGAELTFAYTGDVVLDVDAGLRRVTTDDPSTTPLTVVPATITVGTSGCNAADIASEFGVLNVNDIITFVNAFNGGDLLADVSPAGGDGALNVNDIIDFVNAFNAGCP